MTLSELKEALFAFDSTDNSSVTMSPGGLYRQLDKAPAVTAAFWCRRRQNPSGDRRLIFISTSVNSVCFEVYMRPDGNIRIGAEVQKQAVHTLPRISIGAQTSAVF